ncbi:uncharacterized protein LACBIDRAFT_296566 [Laccaria bicolor S238N-H82]|uniref:Predicted protein n=1 Tax=Laccaria bicolor (strain S238N-H82 / ATCC MYA-4686) TaxID=486041 RepID=B0D946_LACBS|nr:uncharacterized protein LACBIDRAFT_296566 [Laccaria bicolor S238N-H82]EDR08947.1 predicted protein [Laccaria bicolor S238N-H82]|eukprot:XP_001880260.1 predicted protein [Laccaria bicolor S238N-H82]
MGSRGIEFPLCMGWFVEQGLPHSVNSPKTNQKCKYSGGDSKSLHYYLRMHHYPRKYMCCCISNSTKTSKVPKGTLLTTSTSKLMGVSPRIHVPLPPCT